MKPSDANKLEALEGRGRQAEELPVEQMLNNAMLRDVNSKKGDTRGIV